MCDSLGRCPGCGAPLDPSEVSCLRVVVMGSARSIRSYVCSCGTSVSATIPEKDDEDD